MHYTILSTTDFVDDLTSIISEVTIILPSEFFVPQNPTGTNSRSDIILHRGGAEFVSIPNIVDSVSDHLLQRSFMMVFVVVTSLPSKGAFSPRSAVAVITSGAAPMPIKRSVLESGSAASNAAAISPSPINRTFAPIPSIFEIKSTCRGHPSQPLSNQIPDDQNMTGGL